MEEQLVTLTEVGIPIHCGRHHSLHREFGIRTEKTNQALAYMCYYPSGSRLCMWYDHLLQVLLNDFPTVTDCNMALWGKEIFSPSGCFLLVSFITATGNEIKTVVSSYNYLLLIGAIFLIQILKRFLVSPVSALDVKYLNLYYKVTEFQTSIRLQDIGYFY